MTLERLEELKHGVSNMAFIALSKLSDKDARQNIVNDGNAMQGIIDSEIARQTAPDDDVQAAVALIANNEGNPVNHGCECEQCKAYRIIVSAALQSIQPKPVPDGDYDLTIELIKNTYYSNDERIGKALSFALSCLEYCREVGKHATKI